jgi:hypothetical protein
VVLEGPTGEALKALAQDLNDGQDKRWGRDAVAHKNGSVFLRWPAAFAGYGLAGKVLLEDMVARGWLVTDPLSPLKMTVMAQFADAPDNQIAIQLSVDAGKAFMALAGGSVQSEVIVATPAAKNEAAAETGPELGKPLPAKQEEEPAKTKVAAIPPEVQSDIKKGKRARREQESPPPEQKPPVQAALPLAAASSKSTRDSQEVPLDAVIAALRAAPMTMDDGTCVVALKDAFTAFESAGLAITKYQEIRRISAQSDGRLKVLPNAIKFKQ